MNRAAHAETENRVCRHYPGLSRDALVAMVEMIKGEKCVPSQEVIQELGSIGLAYRPDRRLRSRRIVLSYLGAKLLK